MEKAIQFPENFIWGASTAAHQIEGNNIASDHWANEYAQNSSVDEPSGDALDSYNRYDEDISLLAGSGLKMYRFSIEWARIEPEQGHFSPAQRLHYRKMIDECHKHGVIPMVTLHHFTNPAWFARQGGWKQEHAVDLFARYVEYIKPILCDVQWVCTINEPNMVAMDPSDTRPSTLPADQPYHPRTDMQVFETLIDAHRRARSILSDIAGLKTGWSVAAITYQGLEGCEAEAREYAKHRVTDFLEVSAGDNFAGVQAYQRYFVGENGLVATPGDYETTLCGWEYYPPALGKAVRAAWNVNGHTPIFVTENGIATHDDDRRLDYTYGALRSIKSAMDDGVQILGYLHWSLIDNYEWGSYKPTFGLISCDRTTFERVPKPSLSWLGNISKTGIVRR